MKRDSGRLAMGDFEIYANYRHEGQLQGAERALANDVAEVIRAPQPVTNGEMWHVRGQHAAANIMLLPSGGEDVWPVFEAHPYLIDLHFLGEADEWSNSAELARHVFHGLDALSRYELLLVHDLEEYVDSNFSFQEKRGMRRYGVTDG
ncbi:hypothetical protein [Streptomyces dubilierae]|uniref:Uncharacterized protein n=1 Tax=Streptomyces dubilierae TaxID=3075533 RepID=A0ABU2PJM7_9ACTN|nr:hypothetical protein [Streptomyces sp. DSM 41921]MDT0392361.1 hypothetical protein [Streptomyces sp. DSM 41921]